MVNNTENIPPNIQISKWGRAGGEDRTMKLYVARNIYNRFYIKLHKNALRLMYS